MCAVCLACVSPFQLGTVLGQQVAHGCSGNAGGLESLSTLRYGVAVVLHAFPWDCLK